MENEFDVMPELDKVLGTDTFPIPSPKRPLGAAASRKEPVWTFPHLHNSVHNWYNVTQESKILDAKDGAKLIVLDLTY